MRFLHRGPEWRWLVILAVIALVIRLGWAIVMMDRVPRFDEVDYIGHATRLAAGEGYVDQTGHRVAYWPVGYPALLSLVFRLTGPSQTMAVGLQIALGVATCLLLSMVGTRVLGPRPGRLAGLFLALYPTHVMYSTLHLTEPLFTLLLLGAISCLSLEKRPGLVWQMAAGLLLGLAGLTRPLIVLFPLLLPFGLHEKGQGIKKALPAVLVVVATTLLTISPWLWRNQQLTGRWTALTTSGGFNFWVGNNPAARGGYVDPQDPAVPLRNQDGDDWHRGFSLGWDAIRENPVAAGCRLPLKVSHFVALETDGVLWNLKGLDRTPRLPLILFLLFLANAAYLLALGTASLALLGRPDMPAFGKFTVLLCGYMLAIVMIFFGDPRFHMPLMPFLLLFSASLFKDEMRWLSPGPDGTLLEARVRLLFWSGIMLALGLLMVIHLAVKHAEGAW